MRGANANIGAAVALMALGAAGGWVAGSADGPRGPQAEPRELTPGDLERLRRAELKRARKAARMKKAGL